MTILKILIGVNILLASLTLTLNNRYRAPKSDFFRFLDLFLLFSLLHLIYVFTCKVLFPGDSWLENSAPFGLMYGPFLYLGQKVAFRGKLSYSDFLIHFAVFLIFFLVQAYLLWNHRDIQNADRELYIKILYILVPISMVVYSIVVLSQGRGRIKIRPFFTRELVMYMGPFLLVVGLLFLRRPFAKYANITIESYNPYLAGVVIYLLYFGALTVLLRIVAVHYRRERSRKFQVTPEEIPAFEAKSGKEMEPLYTKSHLSEEIMDIYESRLDDLMSGEETFLEHELKLATLAEKLRIPEHYITQVLSLRKRKNFNEFINGYRVRYSCEMIRKGGKTKSLREISYLSGFNSKVTFNRWFKKIMGTSPSEYRERVFKAENE